MKVKGMKNCNLNICFFVMSIVISFTGCTAKEKKISHREDLVITIREPQNKGLLKMSTFFKKGRIVPLETTGEDLLTEIKKFYSFKNRFYVLDKENRVGIFCFDEDGKYLYRIGQKGQGPEEFGDLIDFTLDKERQLIYGYDAISKKIFVWSLDGLFKEAIYVDYPARAIDYRNDKFYLSSINMTYEYKYNLRITNRKGKIIAEHFPSDPTKISLRPYFKQTDDALYFYPHYHCDTIFDITNDNPQIAYRVDYGKNAITPEDLFRVMDVQESDRYPTWKIFMEKNCICGFSDFLPLKDLLIFGYYCEGPYSVIYDKKHDQCFNGLNLVDDVNHSGLIGKLLYSDNDQIITCNTVDILKLTVPFLQGEFYEKNKLIDPKDLPEAVAHMQELLDRLEEDANPVLVIYQLK